MLIKKQFLEEISISGNIGYIKVKIIPKSQKNEIVERLEYGFFKLKITEIPEKSKANKEICKFLKKEFREIFEDVEIASGETSQIKILKIKFQKK